MNGIFEIPAVYKRIIYDKVCKNMYNDYQSSTCYGDIFALIIVVFCPVVNIFFLIIRIIRCIDIIGDTPIIQNKK